MESGTQAGEAPGPSAASTELSEDLDQAIRQLEQDPDTAAQADALAQAEYFRHDLIKQLRERRDQLELSQTALAERVGTSQPAIARLEGGLSDPMLSTIERCAAGLMSNVAFSLKRIEGPLLLDVANSWNTPAPHRWQDAFTDDVDVKLHGVVEGVGLAATEALFDVWRRAFPQGLIESQTIVEEGQSATLEGTLIGQQEGELATLLGLFPPTGRWVRVPFVWTSWIAKGKLASLTMYLDWLALLTQLGILPAPHSAEVAGRSSF